MPKVSVIMPSLNVGKYIEECLNSVVNQTLKDIEIIAVDAGSTDGTLETIEKFAADDKRIRIINADKKSYGYQMNLGLAAATGEYIGIVETDDMIELNMYEILVKYADEYGLDYVKGYVYVFYDFGNNHSYRFETAKLFDKYQGVVCPAENAKLLCQDIFIWPGIYRQSFLQNILIQ